jgi:hypothetical protein
MLIGWETYELTVGGARMRKQIWKQTGYDRSALSVRQKSRRPGTGFAMDDSLSEYVSIRGSGFSSLTEGMPE